MKKGNNYSTKLKSTKP